MLFEKNGKNKRGGNGLSFGHFGSVDQLTVFGHLHHCKSAPEHNFFKRWFKILPNLVTLHYGFRLFGLLFALPRS